MRLKELGKLQKDYRQLLKNGITKKAMCELVIPFRDKWRLSDQQALAIVRNEISLDEICKLMAKPRQTNADHIRAMSDEELEKFINHFNICDRRTNDECKMSYCACCEVCVMDWLQRPAEEENHA